MSEEESFRFSIADALSRPVDERISLGLFPMRLPVMAEKPYRIFEKMEDYRKWMETELPRYLGYYRDD